MTLQRTDEVLTFTKEHYIDKTQELKKGIETFPSIFIEGAAESGKTVAVNMLMKEQKDTDGNGISSHGKNITLKSGRKNEKNSKIKS